MVPSVTKMEDSFVWHFNPSGCYTVHSGYWVKKTSTLNPSVSGLGRLESWWKPSLFPQCNKYTRNQVVHNKGVSDADEVFGWAESFIKDFRQSFGWVTLVVSGGSVLPRWHAHDRGIFKIKTNDANFQPQIAEALAIYKGIMIAVNNGIVPAFLDSNALNVFNAIRS
ncbi:hypothetical protein QYF36_001943 [Acer negundo]|nr:hypothetical protein QYF36_001943 [Acer negundo]